MLGPSVIGSHWKELRSLGGLIEVRTDIIQFFLLNVDFMLYGVDFILPSPLELV